MLEKKLSQKDINQVNICISHQSEDYNSKNKIYTDILANIIGGSMSSRLFQEIREKNGLAYSVYTYNQILFIRRLDIDIHWNESGKL